MLEEDDRVYRYIRFRARTAISGMALAVALCATSLPTWLSDSDSPSIRWNLWELATGHRSGIQPPVDSAQAWGRGMAFFVLLSVVLVLVTAAEVTFAWSVATGVATVVTFAFEIGFRFGARYHIVDNDYLYRTGGAGAIAAMWVLPVVVLWAAAIAYTTRNPASASRSSAQAV